MDSLATPSQEERGKDSVDQLHRTIARLFTTNKLQPPAELPDALDAHRLLPWPLYTGMLFELDTTVEERRQLRVFWRIALACTAQAQSGQVTGDAADQPGSPETPSGHLANRVLDTELQATTEAGFTALLKTVQVRSGYTAARLAKLAAIPRSQAYSMVSRKKLPTRAEQVSAFVTACGLPAHQVQRVMGLWAELRERKARGGALDRCDDADDSRAVAPAWGALFGSSRMIEVNEQFARKLTALLLKQGRKTTVLPTTPPHTSNCPTE